MANKNKEIQDEFLLKLIVDGNHDAFATLVRKHTTRFYNVAFKILKSKQNSEDVIQECFLKLWQSPQNWNSEKGVKFTTWFTTIVTNKSLDQIKSKKTLSLDENFDLADPRKSQLEILEDSYASKAFWNGYSKLKTNQKRALSLSFIENLKNQQSAQIMGISVKAFQSLLMRSKESLQKILKKDPEFYGKK